MDGLARRARRPPLDRPREYGRTVEHEQVNPQAVATASLVADGIRERQGRQTRAVERRDRAGRENAMRRDGMHAARPARVRRGRGACDRRAAGYHVVEHDHVRVAHVARE